VNPVFCSLKLENLKKMKILSMQLFLVVILAMTVSAEWKPGNNGLVYWDSDCDFYDRTFPIIATKPSTGEQCGGVCIANPSCKYFVYRDGLCFLKSGPNGGLGLTAYQPSQVCGYVRIRI
jgi:hypothetical protein